jgi:hypothetical protein
MSEELRHLVDWTRGRSGDRYTPLVRCPTCCETFSLSRHTIAADGAVTPSVVCPRCGWHAWVTLVGWIEVRQ